MNSQPLVDVVIPVYNRDYLLLEALKSVLGQTYENIHIYIIEDGSRLLNKYIGYFQKNKKITFIQLYKNQGVSYCRNLGALSGNGKYVAFLDSDDLWREDKISRQISFLTNQNSFRWVHTYEAWFREGKPVSQRKEHKKQGGIFFEKLVERCLISPSSVLFEKKFFLDSGGFLNHFKVAEDYELWLRLNLENPIGYIDEPLTIKQAGKWDQLSQVKEIDRQRVLALHRIYRLNKHNPKFKAYLTLWKNEIINKTHILIKGSEKYDHVQKVEKYQYWLKVFNTF